MKIGFLIDPIENLKAYKDTSVAMIQAACSLNHECFYFTSSDLYSEADNSFANIHALNIKNINQSDWYEIENIGIKPLGFFDIIIMRKDPPFNLEYIYITYALDLAKKQGVLVSNNPQSLRDANEKFFILHFAQCTTASIVTKDIKLLTKFWQQHRKVVFKPLYGMGGQAIFVVNEDGANLGVILDTLTESESTTIMAQVYIPEISDKGDKRVLLINGKPLPFGLARIPLKGETRGNLAVGGSGKVMPLVDRDYYICQKLAPTLQQKGLHFVGIDIIGDYLTEINVTSPTCLREIMNETKTDYAQEYINFLVNEASYQSSI